MGIKIHILRDLAAKMDHKLSDDGTTFRQVFSVN